MCQEILCRHATLHEKEKYGCDLDGKECAFIKPILKHCLKPAQYKFNENPEKGIHEYCNGTFTSE